MFTVGLHASPWIETSLVIVNFDFCLSGSTRARGLKLDLINDNLDAIYSRAPREPVD